MGEIRSIDANALLDQNNWSIKQYSEEEADAWRDGIALMKKNIENAPTIDPEALRPESEWELNPGRITCEHFRCKKCYFINCVATKYCGECGAKMKNSGIKPEELPFPRMPLPEPPYVKELK